MQSKTTFNRIGRFLRHTLTILGLFCFITGSAQTYVNGGLSTGATSLNGTAAPAGTTWHELQNDAGNNTESNTLLASSHFTPYSIADDFTVPAGPSWNIQKMTFYAIQIGATVPT